MHTTITLSLETSRSILQSFAAYRPFFGNVRNLLNLTPNPPLSPPTPDSCSPSVPAHRIGTYPAHGTEDSLSLSRSFSSIYHTRGRKEEGREERGSETLFTPLPSFAVGLSRAVMGEVKKGLSSVVIRKKIVFIRLSGYEIVLRALLPLSAVRSCESCTLGHQEMVRRSSFPSR